jgi:hypothetical protein
VRSKRIGWVISHAAFRPEIEDFPGNSTTWKECTFKSRSKFVDVFENGRRKSPVVLENRVELQS